LSEFKQQLVAAVDTILNGETLSAEVLTDGTLEPGSIGLDFARQLEDLGPWGQRFAEPLFEGRFQVVDQRVVGVGHMKLRLRPHESTTVIDAIAFNCTTDQLGGGSSVQVLYRLDINRWRGQETAQLRIEKIVSA
jgi:single-stranded-DNA-specific exonuclease